MLTTTSEYALRALICLARQQSSGAAVLGRNLAHDADIPANYLSKVLLTLRNAGLVDTARGSGGGYRLRKAASEIFLVDIVELFEQVSRNKPACFLRHAQPCSAANPCAAHAAWRHIQTEYLEFLVSTPLSLIAEESIAAGPGLTQGASSLQTLTD